MAFTMVLHHVTMFLICFYHNYKVFTMGFTIVLLSVNRDIQKIRKNNEPGALERRHENSINMASSFPLVPLTM